MKSHNLLRYAVLGITGAGLLVGGVSAEPHRGGWELQSQQVEIEESLHENRPFLEAVHRAVVAIAAKDFDGFERLFAQRVNGMEPDELWKGASVVLMKLGAVKKIGFSEMDGDGAFVKVTFERAEREFFVRLDDEGLLRELTYVPPLNVHDR